MDEQQTNPTGRTEASDRKPDARRTYATPVVVTERATETVVLAASTGCGTVIDESSGCDFAV